MGVAEYATLSGLRVRLFGPDAGPTPNDSLLADICREVNDFIEGPTGAGRVLGPISPFSAQVTADAGDRSLTLPSVDGLRVGDRLLLGNITDDHEVASVLAIEANTTLAADVWAVDTYNAGDIVQPTTPNGHTYRCVIAGTTDAEEPTWPTDGTAVIDGMAVWLDEGTTDSTVHLAAELAFDHVSAPLQRVLVADGSDARGRGLKVRSGVIVLAIVETNSTTYDFTLRPTRDNLRPGWPHTHVVLRTTAFPSGLDNVLLVGPGPCVDLPDAAAFGFPAIPDDVRAVAYTLAATRWQMRQSGGTYDVAPGTDQVSVGQFLISRTDYALLRSYNRDWGIG